MASDEERFSQRPRQPRSEATASWPDLTPEQRRAHQQAKDLLWGMLEEAERPPRRRTRDEKTNVVFNQASWSHAVLLDGARGSGKTTTFFTLLESLSAPPDGHDSKTPFVTLPVLDLHPLPSHAKLIVLLLARFAPLVRQYATKATPSDAMPWRRAEGDDLLGLWERLMRHVAVGWTIDVTGRIASADPDALAVDLNDAETLRYELHGVFRAFMDGLSNAVARAEQLSWGPLFVVPIDDADMNVPRSVEILELLRNLFHPRLAFVLTGQSQLFLMALRAHFARAIWGPLANLPLDSKHASSISSPERVIQLADDFFDRVVPPQQRCLVPTVAPERRTDVLVKLLHDPQHKTVGNSAQGRGRTEPLGGAWHSGTERGQRRRGDGGAGTFDDTELPNGKRSPDVGIVANGADFFTTPLAEIDALQGIAPPAGHRNAWSPRDVFEAYEAALPATLRGLKTTAVWVQEAATIAARGPEGTPTSWGSAARRNPHAAMAWLAHQVWITQVEHAELDAELRKQLAKRVRHVDDVLRIDLAGFELEVGGVEALRLESDLRGRSLVSSRLHSWKINWPQLDTSLPWSVVSALLFCADVANALPRRYVHHIGPRRLPIRGLTPLVAEQKDEPAGERTSSLPSFHAPNMLFGRTPWPLPGWPMVVDYLHFANLWSELLNRFEASLVGGKESENGGPRNMHGSGASEHVPESQRDGRVSEQYELESARDSEATGGFMLRHAEWRPLLLRLFVLAVLRVGRRPSAFPAGKWSQGGELADAGRARQPINLGKERPRHETEHHVERVWTSARAMMPQEAKEIWEQATRRAVPNKFEFSTFEPWENILADVSLTAASLPENPDRDARTTAWLCSLVDLGQEEYGLPPEERAQLASILRSRMTPGSTTSVGQADPASGAGQASAQKALLASLPAPSPKAEEHQYGADEVTLEVLMGQTAEGAGAKEVSAGSASDVNPGQDFLEGILMSEDEARFIVRLEKIAGGCAMLHIANDPYFSRNRPKNLWGYFLTDERIALLRRLGGAEREDLAKILSAPTISQVRANMRLYLSMLPGKIQIFWADELLTPMPLGEGWQALLCESESHLSTSSPLPSERTPLIRLLCSVELDVAADMGAQASRQYECVNEDDDGPQAFRGCVLNFKGQPCFAWPKPAWPALYDDQLVMNQWRRAMRALAKRGEVASTALDSLALYLVDVIEGVGTLRTSIPLDKLPEGTPAEWRDRLLGRNTVTTQRAVWRAFERRYEGPRWEAYDQWRRRLPILAAPEMGLSTDVAAAILSAAISREDMFPEFTPEGLKSLDDEILGMAPRRTSGRDGLSNHPWVKFARGDDTPEPPPGAPSLAAPKPTTKRQAKPDDK